MHPIIVVLTIFKLLIIFLTIVQYSYIVYNVEVVYIYKNNHLIFHSPTPTYKFLAPPLLTRLEKSSGAATIYIYIIKNLGGYCPP